MNMEKVNVECLVIEVTRECNAKCSHCLRGESMKGNINKKIIRELLSNIKNIHEITFSGGEPTLYTRAIRDTLNIAKELDVKIDSFFVATNGIKYSRRLVLALFDLTKYCMECTGETILYDFCFNGGAALALSIDDFHPRPCDKAFRYYMDLPFYSNCKTKKGKEHLIREGRSNYGVGIHRDNFNFSYSAEDNCVDEIYCNIYGNIFPCCDFSFERQDNDDIYNIFDISLIEIVEDTFMEKKALAI